MHAAAGNDITLPTGGIRQSRQLFRIDAGQRAVLGNIRENEGTHSGTDHFPGKGNVVHIGIIQPALCGYLAVFGIDPHCDPTPVFCHRFLDNPGVFQGNGSKNHPADTPGQVIFHRVQRTDAASELHLQRRMLCYIQENVSVDRLCGFCPVQIHHMDPLGTCLRKSLGSVHIAFCHLFRSLEIPLPEPDTFSVLDINCW